jgi:poly(3-hydroxybutyrate) depolymerase
MYLSNCKGGLGVLIVGAGLHFKLAIGSLVLLTLASIAAGQKISKGALKAANGERSYYLLVPDKLDNSKPVPLVVLLHGSGRNGQSLVDRWKDLALKEGFIVVGPNSLNAADWQIPADGPDFIYELVEDLKTKFAIDPRRIYVFGHSGGAIQALHLALYESEYFAAVVAHAGVIDPRMMPFIERATRKIPISIFVGTNDQFFPLKDVRATRDALNKGGFNAQLTEIKGHTHDYYSKSDEINNAAWEFLKAISLSADPRYQKYAFSK